MFATRLLAQLAVTINLFLATWPRVGRCMKCDILVVAVTCDLISLVADRSFFRPYVDPLIKCCILDIESRLITFGGASASVGAPHSLVQRRETGEGWSNERVHFGNFADFRECCRPRRSCAGCRWAWTWTPLRRLKWISARKPSHSRSPRTRGRRPSTTSIRLAATRAPP